MNKYPIYQATGTPTGAVGSVRTNIKIPAAIGAQYAAMGHFADTALAVGTTVWMMQGEVELAKAQAADSDDMYKMFAKFETTDPDTYKQQFADTMVGIHAREVKNGWAARRRNLLLEKNTPLWDAKMMEAAAKKTEERYNNELALKTAEAEATGNFTDLEATTQRGVAAGWLDEYKVGLKLGVAKHNSQVNKAQAFAMRDANGAIAAISGDKMAGYPELGPTEVKAVLSTARQTLTQHKDQFEAASGRIALDWDTKLQAWDNPESKPEDRLTFQDIATMKLPEFEGIYGNDIIAYKEHWRKLLEKKLDDKAEGPIATPTDVLVQANQLVANVRAGKRAEGGMSLQEALTEYTKIAGDVKDTNNESFIAKLFAAAENSKVPEKQRMSDALAGRKKQLRDAIERVPNFFDLNVGEQEILKDLANRAVNKLEDQFGGLEWESITDLDAYVDRLIVLSSRSPAQLKTIAMNNNILASKTYAEQQKKLRQQLDILQKTQPDAAKAFLRHMIELGYADADGKPSATKDKEPVNKSRLRNMLQSFTGAYE